MSERLRASDLALLADETPHTPMHTATLEIFEPGARGF
ncbi:MAG: wax ester/triacylglycerol synthase family O-acyltransferase, partial [Marmoricola sp.]|nr:wax ester/triacylglycerol synthase family O-acyltransferase [Marmoricola sp.]